MDTEFIPIFLFVLVAIMTAVSMLLVSALLGPKRRTDVKQMPYESGMDPIGDARQRFDVKFYLIAILFLVFDVELLFLYPWAVIAYSDGAAPAWRAVFGRIGFIEILIFIATLVIAYVYAWRKGVLRWQ
jgi:NADH:ubiquinone oxidoreductase subunit 3 (subunit A)